MKILNAHKLFISILSKCGYFKPVITIILPVYNVAEYLSRCLDTVINQSLYNIEIILASDGPDDCDRICKQFADKDWRIKIVTSPGSYGKAVNKALSIAKGKYVGIVECDDWLDLDMYLKLYDCAIKAKADVCKAAFWCVFDDFRKNFTVYTNFSNGILNLNENPLILSCQPSIWSAIYRKEFLLNNKIMLIESRLSYIDSPFHIETLLKSRSTVILNEPLYYYYMDNPNQSVRSSEKILDGLCADRYIFDILNNICCIDKRIYDALAYTFYLHTEWNYLRMKSYTNKSIFLKEYKEFLREVGDHDINFTHFTTFQRLFFYIVKNFSSPIVLDLYIKFSKLLHYLNKLKKEL